MQSRRKWGQGGKKCSICGSEILQSQEFDNVDTIKMQFFNERVNGTRMEMYKVENVQNSFLKI